MNRILWVLLTLRLNWKTPRKTHGFTQVSDIAKGNVVFVPFKENSNMIT